MRTFNLFISHSWSYSNQYNNLVDLLNQRPYFSYRNYSIPIDDPVHTSGSSAELYDAIRKHIRPTQIVVILAGVYSSYSDWIDKEIEIAQSEFLSPKPILAVEPWGAQRTSLRVKLAADKIVRWNTESVVGGIRELVG